MDKLDLERWMLMRTRELLSDETKWVKGARAVAANGLPCPDSSKIAVRRSLLTALKHARYGAAKELGVYYGSVPFDSLYEKFKSLVRQEFPQRSTRHQLTLTQFNDHSATTWADLCWLFHKVALAIENGSTRMQFDHTTEAI